MRFWWNDFFGLLGVHESVMSILGYSGFVVGNSVFPTIERRGAIPSHGILSERSSPSRVRFAAKNAPLTAPGRSEDLSVTKEWEISGTAALHVAGPMSLATH